MKRHTILISLAMLLIVLGLVLISLAAPIVSWIVVLGIAAVLLLASHLKRRRLNP